MFEVKAKAEKAERTILA